MWLLSVFVSFQDLFPGCHEIHGSELSYDEDLLWFPMLIIGSLNALSLSWVFDYQL